MKRVPMTREAENALRKLFQDFGPASLLRALSSCVLNSSQVPQAVAIKAADEILACFRLVDNIIEPAVCPNSDT